DEYPVNQVATPSLSSWGQNGFNEVWLNGENDWIYRHLHASAERIERLSRANRQANGLTRRALDQAARELLLAQSSDWAFMINSGGMKEYAVRRTKSHLLRLNRLSQEVENGTIDESWLRELENQDSIFCGMPVAEAYIAADTTIPKPVPI